MRPAVSRRVQRASSQSRPDHLHLRMRICFLSQDQRADPAPLGQRGVGLVYGWGAEFGGCDTGMVEGTGRFLGQGANSTDPFLAPHTLSS